MLIFFFFLLQQHYRYWVLWRCPTVRFLDYQKVKDAEREKARELFGSADAPTELASRVSRDGDPHIRQRIWLLG